MNERYNLEKAQEEAEILRKKVESGEVSSYPEAQERLRDREEIIEREATRVAERSATLISLAQKICEGPITLESLAPLIDVVADAEEFDMLNSLASRVDPGIGLREIEQINRFKKILEETPYATKRRAAFSIIWRGAIGKNIIKPVLKERFPDINDYNKQIEAITMGLKKAHKEEGRNKRKK